jgi:hypothetical protein
MQTLQLSPMPVAASVSPVAPRLGSTSQEWPPWLDLSERLSQSHRPRDREAEESDTGGWACSLHLYYQWPHPRLDQPAEHLSLQALPRQDPQRSCPAQRLSLVPLASVAILGQVPAL